MPGDFVTALLAEALLLKNPGARILYDLRASRAVPDVITANGGVPLLNRVGHAFFKQRMRREGGLFGGEVSGHYYFADNYNADSGFIPALLILELLSQKKATMAELLEPLRTQVLHQRRDQLHRRRRAGGAGAHRGAVLRRRAGPSRRHLGRLRRLALQRARRPTPSRSCASTWAPTRRRSWRRSATSCSPSSARADVERSPTWAGAGRRGRPRRHVRRGRRPAAAAARRATRRARARLAGAFFGTFPAIPPAEPTASSSAAWAAPPSAPTSCSPPARPSVAGRRRARVRAARVGRARDAGRRRQLLGADRRGARLCARQARSRGCVPVCVSSGGSLRALAEAEGLPLVVVPGGGQPRAAVGLLSMPLLATLEASGLCHEHAERRRGGCESRLEADNAILGPGSRGRREPRQERSPVASRSGWPSSTAPGPPLRSPGAGRARSTRTRRLRPSSTSCRSSITTSSWGGRACRTSPRPPSRCSCTTSPARSVWSRRAELTAREYEALGVATELVAARGDSPLARLFSLVQLGDYASCYLARAVWRRPDAGRRHPGVQGEPRRRRRLKPDGRRGHRARPDGAGCGVPLRRRRPVPRRAAR